jgi:hypothetical protein
VWMVGNPDTAATSFHLFDQPIFRAQNGWNLRRGLYT